MTNFKKTILLMVLSIGLNLTAIAQVSGPAREVKGVVVDATGEPVIGASIVEKKNRTNGLVSDVDGKFSIKVSEHAILIVSYVGYNSQEVTTDGMTMLKVILTETAHALEDVVVIGYGSVKKSNLTSSVSKITDQALEDRPVTTVGEAFQGQLAGVQAQASNGGIPGEEMTIRIRGINTVNGDTSPLYVIDGIPRDNMSDINPNDVASVQILKDASATSIYGSRGANGVVLIETKQGKGKATVTFDAYYGVQTPEKSLNLESGKQYLAYNMYARNVNYMIIGGSMSDPMSKRPQDYRIPDWWSNYSDFTDWQGLVLRNAPMQSYSASASGNNQMGSIYLSMGWQDQEGIIIGTDFNRYNVRLNGVLNLTEKLKVGANLAFSSSLQDAGGVNLGDRQGKDGAVHHALMVSPLVKQGAAVRTSSNPSGGVSQPEYGSSYIDPEQQLIHTTDQKLMARTQTPVGADIHPCFAPQSINKAFQWDFTNPTFLSKSKSHNRLKNPTNNQAVGYA